MEHHMTIIDDLNREVEAKNLLNSPFYQAWSHGTLPTSALAAYAEEYGAFIAMLSKGWETQGDDETAEEETEHAELWEKFAAALNTRIGEAKISAAKNLLLVASELFESTPEALGALYAFEVQQPATAQSKLDGLKTHYPQLVDGAKEYFDIHCANHHEAEKLSARINALPVEEQARALKACTMMSDALWEALGGIYNAHVQKAG
jgi:pyrroloquinoline-quinone synthase